MTSPASPRVALVTSNGWGLGHLSREIAIALAVGDRADLTMFSFSRGLPLASRFGIRGEFCPGQDSPWIPVERWNTYVESRFRAFLGEVQPDVVMFDGVAPYLGILNALLDQPSISAGWLRRGMWLSGPTDLQLTKSSSFDFVVEPGDLAAEVDTGPTSALEALRVPPVSLIDVIPMLDREEAARQLDLDPARPALLFAFGSGQPGDSAHARQAALDRALDHDDWQVALVNSPLSTRPPEDVPGAIQLEGVYPLLRYLAAFDAAVSAAGYNSVHELVPAGIPTLLVPKSASQTDDQMTRARYLADRGMASMAADDDPDAVRRGVDSLLGQQGDSLRATLADANPESLGGAAAVADLLVSTPPVGVRDTGQDEWRQPGIKGFVKRSIGPRGVELVQRALGRAPRRPARNPVTLDPDAANGSTHLLVTADPTSIPRVSDQPVEHILPGASSDYEKVRRDIVDDFYDVV